VAADRPRQILATSGGFEGPSTDPYRAQRGALINYALELTGVDRPQLCFLTTASGDNDAEIALYYNAFAGSDDAVVTHLELFMMPNHLDPRAHLLAQDVIWVSGGSVANLLAVWRAHGLDTVFREAWEAGIVLSGVSAGSLCWHVGGTTDSFGPDLVAIDNGLGLLPYANGVHYDSEAQRRPLFQALIAEGRLPEGYATDDGVGLLYRGTELVEAVSELDGKGAYHVRRGTDGQAVETRLDVRRL
jgi:peptidase E